MRHVYDPNDPDLPWWLWEVLTLPAPIKMRVFHLRRFPVVIEVAQVSWIDSCHPTFKNALREAREHFGGREWCLTRVGQFHSSHYDHEQQKSA